MNELTRMQYMDALGIAMYVPRFVLPGAKLSGQALLPAGDSEPVELERVETLRPGRAAALASAANPAVVEQPLKPVQADQLLSQLRQASAPDKSPVTSPAVRSPAVEESSAEREAEAVRFALSIWRAGEKVMVLDSRQPQEALPTQNLLKNILAAKNLSLTGNKPEIINWPMFGGSNEPQGWPAASEMVLAFLHARLERQASEQLWVMGKNAFAAIYGSPTQYQEQLGKSNLLESLKVNLVVLPSLSEMIQQPALKRVTWLAIRDAEL